MDTAALPTLTYLLESGTDRIGANDFQPSAEVHVPREVEATLEEILHAAGRLEAVAMELARRVGLDVAATSTTSVLGRDVLLVERFDREPGSGRRHALVSALTLLGLHELHARYATYPDLADVVRHRFVDPERTLHELFRRLVFNVLTGNRDDHPRNHAAFWDGRDLRQTPAYDLCPQPRHTGEATQAMAITRDGRRASRLQLCLEAAGVFLHTEREARDEIERQLTLIHEQWSAAADHVGLTAADRQQLWGHASSASSRGAQRQASSWARATSVAYRLQYRAAASGPDTAEPGGESRWHRVRRRSSPGG